MKRFIRLVAILFLIYSGLSFVIGLIGTVDQEDDNYYDEELYTNEEACEEYTKADSLETDIRLTHYRSWNKYSFDSVYCLTYSMSAMEAYPSFQFRNELNSEGETYEEYWRNIYYELVQHDAATISFLQDSLKNLAIQASLSRNDLARLIVSFIQDIPYNYVMPGPCDRDDHPCRGNEKFGILSPAEFLFTLTGDCDTRSVLLYSMLKYFGFDSLIVISNEYRHAMIAIDLPATGDHLYYKGKKFYFWETTNTGWLPGMLPPETNNIAYWRITLDHEYQTFPSRYR